MLSSSPPHPSEHQMFYLHFFPALISLELKTNLLWCLVMHFPLIFDHHLPFLLSDSLLLLLSRFSRVRLCNPIDGSRPGSAVPGILQARTLEWVAISFSNAWKWKVKVKSLSRVQLFAIPWTAAYQAPPSMGFSRQEYWSGVPSPSPFLEVANPQMPRIPIKRPWIIPSQIPRWGILLPSVPVVLCAELCWQMNPGIFYS